MRRPCKQLTIETQAATPRGRRARDEVRAPGNDQSHGIDILAYGEFEVPISRYCAGCIAISSSEPHSNHGLTNAPLVPKFAYEQAANACEPWISGARTGTSISRLI